MNKEENLARKFHNAYEELAPSFGYETRTETRNFDPETPNGKLMIAVCTKLLERNDKLPAEIEKVLNALRLEVDGSIVNSVRERVEVEWFKL